MTMNTVVSKSRRSLRMSWRYWCSIAVLTSAIVAFCGVSTLYAQPGSREVASTNRHATMYGLLSWTNNSIGLKNAYLRDFSRPGAPSRSCVYLTWTGTHKNRKEMGCASDGQAVSVNGSFNTNKRPTRPQVTVCSRFGDKWECGRPS